MKEEEEDTHLITCLSSYHIYVCYLSPCMIFPRETQLEYRAGRKRWQAIVMQEIFNKLAGQERQRFKNNEVKHQNLHRAESSNLNMSRTENQ